MAIFSVMKSLNDPFKKIQFQNSSIGPHALDHSKFSAPPNKSSQKSALPPQHNRLNVIFILFLCVSYCFP